jgi:O-antigen ligase
MLQILSPARESLAAAISPIYSTISKAPLSVNPPAALLSLFTVIGYIVTFFLVRELAWRSRPGVWVPVIPLLCIAGLEAAIGMVQVGGTYTNRDHFSGLLEMILPLSVVCGLAILRKGSSMQIAIKVCAVWTVSVVSFVAIIYSLSRAGFVVALASLFVVGALERRLKFASLWIPILLIPMAFIFLTTDPLLERFADKVAGEARPFIWRETLSLIAEFRWFGCGLGGYESTFLKHQAIARDLSIQFAHNDYLQYLAELGIVGFSILSAALIGVLWPIFGGLKRSVDEDRRLLTVGVIGSVVAIGLHSLVDFNMYIPANAMTLAWVVGLGSAHITAYKRSEETPGRIVSAERAEGERRGDEVA